MRRIDAGFTVLFMIAGYLLGCAVHPVTLEKQFMIISEEKEISIGKRSDPVILQQFGYYDDPALQEYVNEVGQKLVAVCSRKDIAYYFKVVDSQDINAFALPGGFIYVTRGILAMMNSEAELAGVLGHEIGHVVGRDSANMISQQTWFQIVALAGMAASPTTRELAMAGNMLFDALMLGYGREKEFLADSQGVDYMFKAGYDPLQMVALQESLGKLHQGPAGYARYLTTHPYVGDRINRARAQAKVAYAMNNVFSPQDKTSESKDIDTIKQSGKLIRADEYKMRLDGLAYGPPDNIRRIKIYTVREDDTLESIAGEVADDTEKAEEIASLNGLESGTPLYTGQKLKVVY
jgi:predicted Zn-dependent protease